MVVPLVFDLHIGLPQRDVAMNIIFSKTFKNVWILSLSNAIAGSTLPLMHLAGTLAGSSLAPSPDWATAPIALMILGTACSVMLVTRTMQRLGRKDGIYVFLAVGLAVCLLAAFALQTSSFVLFCLASFLLGSFNATLLQARFAAMESVSMEHRATAASMVMGAGIIAAFVGPEIAIFGKDLFPTAYQGSFLLAGFCIIISSLMLAFYKAGTSKGHVEKMEIQTKVSARKLFANPTFCLAVMSGAISYVVMSFVMTGTPISMHEIYGHSLTDTKWVIQSHIAAMFLPSFITPILVRYLGVRGMMLLGLMCYCVGIGVGYLNTNPGGFWTQLVMLGIGWNFLFIGGTTLLPSTHHEDDRFSAQSINDFTVFSFQAAAALSAGWALNLIGWLPMILICLIPIGIMVMALIWERSRIKNSLANDYT
jgi:MFS family permease